MNHQPPPLIAVPLDLSDEAAAKWIDCLLAIAHQREDYYSEQLDRYRNGIDERHPDLWSDTDPPFCGAVAPTPHSAQQRVAGHDASGVERGHAQGRVLVATEKCE